MTRTPLGVGSATPQSLLNLFRTLTAEQRKEFVELVARISDTDLFGAFWNALPTEEKMPFMRPLLIHVASVTRPILIRETAEVMKRFPTLTPEELVAPVSEEYAQSITELEEGLILREQAKFKTQRDRPSSPETICRNLEICDLRKSDPKKWSQRRLAKRFDVSRQYIKIVLDEEAHWRRLGRQLTS